MTSLINNYEVYIIHGNNSFCLNSGVTLRYSDAEKSTKAVKTTHIIAASIKKPELVSSVIMSNLASKLTRPSP